MSKFPFLRRPVKLVLYTLLMALVTTAALIFAWQYHLDGVILDHAIDTYAYVGTIVRSDGEILDAYGDRDFMTNEPAEMGGPAFLEEIPEGLVQWLYDSEYVTRIDSRQTQAALLGEYTRVKAEDTAQTQKVPDSMMTVSAKEYFFLEGTVTMVTDLPVNDPVVDIDTYQVQVDKMWSDPYYSREMMVVEVTRLVSEEPLQEGQKIFVLGEQVLMGMDGVASDSQTNVDTPAWMQEWKGPDYELSVIDQNRLTIIPEGVDAEAYIQELLESTGLDEYLERQLRSKYTVTIRRTQDMMMIPLFAQGKAKTYEGRVLTPQDAGKKVCVISNGLSQRNRLSVGDIIRLSVADGCYTWAVNGWESGNPADDDELLEYGEYEEYEIVGIYTQQKRRTTNALYFPYGDIFVPAEEEPQNFLRMQYSDVFVPADGDTAARVVRPYTFSFRVPGPDYLEFQAAFEPVLEEYGYSLVIQDTGWDDVKESFYSMQTRRQFMLLCAAVAFAAAVAVFAVLLSAHCRYEYGLRRLMGASKGEALGIYGSTFLFTGLPGALAAVLAAWNVAVNLIKGAVADDTLLTLPTDAQCAGMLAAWAALELAAVFAVLLVLAWRSERRGLLRLIRR